MLCFYAPLIPTEDVPINGDKDDTAESKTPETSNNNGSNNAMSNNIGLGACPDCGHVMDAAAIEKYRETFELVDAKANAGSSAGIAMDVAEFCFRQMAKVCRIFSQMCTG